jgi:plasminogen activator
MVWRSSLITGMLVPALAAGAAAADQPAASTPVAVPLSSSFSVDLYAGGFSLLAHERVYDVPGTGRKVSQLDWRANVAPVIGGSVSWHPVDRITLRANGFVPVSGNSQMKDYDWLVAPYAAWSDLWIADDTRLARAYRAEASLAGTVLSDSGLSLDLLGGFRRDTIKWNGYGGCYTYSDESFRDQSGCYDPSFGIAYQQWWNSPYLGLGAQAVSGPVTLRLELVASPFAWGRDDDHRVNDDGSQTVFKETFSHARMLGATATAAYRVSDHASLFLRADFESIGPVRGPIYELTATDPADVYAPKPAAGASSRSVLVAAGLSARFP